MTSKTCKPLRRHRRFTNLAAGLLLLFTQLLGAGHSHHPQFQPSIAATGGATGGDTGACPICLGTLHTPLTVSSRPLVFHAEIVASGSIEQPIIAYSVPALDSPHGRAPPVRA
jgi:hypothetical protein